MTIAPIVHSVEVKASPARAFALFTADFGKWRPAMMTIGANPALTVQFEPKPGGMVFEQAQDGAVTQWGRVLAWNPPSRLLFTWQISSQWTYDPDLLTEVEVRFEAAGEGRTKVTLVHSKLEAYGADADKHSEGLRNGWPGILASFGAYADANA
jgi:uncharacterized protein YndB with AHSA1/START domain